MASGKANGEGALKSTKLVERERDDINRLVTIACSAHLRDRMKRARDDIAQ
jgi:hypothetical protein